MNLRTFTICWLGMLLSPIAVAGGAVIYVDGDSAGGDGSSWATAFEYLQDALAVADANDEIRVAQGTYVPDQNSVNPGGSGDREDTFQLINGVVLKGGYAGFGEAEPDERDVEVYETILSGDLNGDDGAGFANNGENSYHVITGDENDPDTVLDGLTITAGNANSSSYRDKAGGGIMNSGSPTLSNCKITGNYAAGSGASDGGGGMYNSGSPVLTNCTFEENAAGSGAGMNNHFGSPILIDCQFIANSSDRGGGMYFHHSRYAKLINCAFIDNSAGDSGGGFYNEWGEGAASLINCAFIGNSAGSGGGMYNTVECAPELVNCIFSGNSADEGGAITVFRASDLTLTNCTLAANSAGRGRALFCDSWSHSNNIRITNCILWDGGGEIWNNDDSDITITYSDVQGGWVDVGNINSDPLFVDSDGPDDVVGTEDDDLRLLPESPCVDAGDNSSVPPDTTDVDGDGNLVEPIPLDYDRNPRFADDPDVPDTGNPGEPPGPIVDIGAYEGHNLVLSAWLINIAEGQSATFTVALSYDPGGTVEVTVAHESGDPDITVESGGTLTFNSSNYRQGQTVTLAAGEDVDSLNSVAFIQVSSAGFSIQNKVRVVERDNDRYPRSIVFVDAGAAGINNGSGWMEAYTCLQDALSFAVEFPDVEIRVAQGVYRPDEGLDVTAGDRDATFQLINSVIITGGYAGCGARNPGARNIDLCETILCGDLYDNDGPGEWENNDENSYHVVTGSNTDATAILDGFTIRNGNANHSDSYDPRRDGGGMYIISGTPTLANCTLRNNTAANYGGGIYNRWNSSPTLTNCKFYGNQSYCAGGIYNESSSSPILSNCTFIGNSAVVAGAIGNYRNYGSPTVIADCAFIENSSTSYSGVMTNYRSDLILTNCIFGGNSTADGAGGVMRDYESDAMFVNCTFSDNSAGSDGGALWCYQCDTTLINCILWGNTAAGNGSQIALKLSSTASINNTCLQGGQGADAIYLQDDSSVNWGQGNIDVDPMFADADNTDYHLKSQAGRWDPDDGRWTTDEVTSPCIDTGDPASAWTAELWPHGKCVNMGAFGGTPQASLSESSLGNRADLDNSGCVDFGDFAGLIDWWQAEGPLRAEDLNRDAIVNFFDILEFIEEWLWQEI